MKNDIKFWGIFLDCPYQEGISLSSYNLFDLISGVFDFGKVDHQNKYEYQSKSDDQFHQLM